MRRAFSQLASRLLKSKDNELKSTLKYLTNGSIKSLGSLFESSESSRRGSLLVRSSNKESNLQDHHIENILRILNSNLPEVESKKQKVAVHYDVLFSQLNSIVTQAADNEGTSSKQLRTASSEDLYDRLLLLQYMGKLTNVRQITEILLSKNFNKFNDLWEHRALFDEYQKVVISILFYYRTHNAQIRKDCEFHWLSNYGDLPFPLRRLLWRCLTFDISQENIPQIISHYIKVLGDSWRHNNLILIYQSLYEKSHLLPELTVLDGNRSEALSFTRNQILLVRILRAISKWMEEEPKLIKKWLISIVKLSIQNKLMLEVPFEAPKSIMDQYKFIRSLDISIQGIYRVCQNRSILEYLQVDLETILKMINDEEHDLKTHLPLNLI
ncbi:hypothetical protein SMKI_10G0680 [Saccharomyces mikatae IFO 1815]|uniref:YJL147C-like protein n=1 Tax=Saccharomyces mikatae IFO 1815 TaxID=226126 RepID=A0AA35IR62_SACMI|nr:uncharacterized protein SMKI_10G0680 [Saccharomyces mikatae IFO 1815]CAI4034283.1 hypothetical protein SMKI_10G0680 [Saccharomyces mikatae IFO 1815]